MKKIIILLFVVVAIKANAQQHNCWGIMTFLGLAVQENCYFDSLCQKTQIDTSNYSNIWQNGTPNKPFFNAAYSAPKAMVTDTTNPYPVNNDSYFELAFPLPPAWPIYSMNTCISFEHKMNTDTLHDGGIIEVKYYRDSAWKNIALDTLPYTTFTMFNCYNLYGIHETLYDGEPGFSGKFDWMRTSIQWVWMLPVKNFASPDTLWLRWRFISDGVETNKDGWMIDNLEITVYDPGSGVEEWAMDRNVSVSPNPLTSSAIVALKTQGEGTYNAQLINIFGQKVKEYADIHDNSFIIERDNLTGGMYYLIVKNGSKIIGEHKIIVP